MGDLQSMMRPVIKLAGWMVAGCLITAPLLWAAETVENSKPKAAVKAPKTKTNAQLELLQRTLKEIRNFKRRGQYLEASQKYALILDEISLSTKDRSGCAFKSAEL